MQSGHWLILSRGVQRLGQRRVEDGGFDLSLKLGGTEAGRDGSKDLPGHSDGSWKQRQALEGQGWGVLGDWRTAPGVEGADPACVLHSVGD